MVVCVGCMLLLHGMRIKLLVAATATATATSCVSKGVCMQPALGALSHHTHGVTDRAAMHCGGKLLSMHMKTSRA
jgi:hypothetical protein